MNLANVPKRCLRLKILSDVREKEKQLIGGSRFSIFIADCCA